MERNIRKPVNGFRIFMLLIPLLLWYNILKKYLHFRLPGNGKVIRSEKRIKYL